MEQSRNYETVKKWYSLGLWDETRVRDAVFKNWISTEEFSEIVNKDY